MVDEIATIFSTCERTFFFSRPYAIFGILLACTKYISAFDGLAEHNLPHTGTEIGGDRFTKTDKKNTIE